jgi:hypothetical protein
MLKPHHAFATALLALAATGLSTAAEAGPCVPGTGTTAVNNTCIGSGALANNTTGYDNAAIGGGALQFNTTGRNNTASGGRALYSNTTGSLNTASGLDALRNNTTGDYNTAIGSSTMYRNTTGSKNTASGVVALDSNTTGSNNTASGFGALYINTTGSNNTASGTEALSSNTTGSSNIALGYQAGANLTTGSNNIIIGNQGTTADLNTIRIGVQGTQTRAFIAGIRGTTFAGGQLVMVNANGQLGVTSSSQRYKENIQPMGDASNPLMQLRPVTFHYKQAEEDGSKPMQYGLIAEEVEQAMPDLVIYNKDGTPESVAYQLLPSLLLNEYQKQTHKLAAAETELAETRSRLEAMDAELAALKLAVSRLAAAPSSVKLAASQP